MQIRTFNQSGIHVNQNKNKNKISFGEQSIKELQGVLKYIANIEKVPEDPSNDIKTVANKNNVLISPQNLFAFSETIKCILNDPELNIKGSNKLKAYKTYLRYLNDNNDLVQNPQKIFPKPEMFGTVIAAHITDYLEKAEKRDIKINEEKAARARELESIQAQNEKTADVEEDQEISRPRHVKTEKWQSQALKALPWGLTAVMGTYIAAQNIGLPAKPGFGPDASRDISAQVDTSKEVQLPTQVNANSDKVINTVKSGSLTLFTLSKNDAQAGDKIEFYGKRVPLYFDQQNQTWGTFLVFPKQVPVENGTAKFPVTLIRQGSEPRKLGVLEVKGNPPTQGQVIPALGEATDIAPSIPSAESLTITQEPFVAPAKGKLGYKYGDIAPSGQFINYNIIASQTGAPVVAPARTKVVKVTENSIVLDGGWGLQFIMSGIKPGNDIQLGKIVERGSKIADIADPNGQIGFQVNVNGRATNFFDDSLVRQG